ncbi:unnamed protein product [Laminaria digitata]
MLLLLFFCQDSPFIRAVGFLYLRYTCPPKASDGTLWGWLEPYVDDEEEFKPSPTEGSMTMGAYVRKIIRWVGGLVGG